MSILHKQLALDASEVEWQGYANAPRGPLWAGGILYVTHDLVIFQPSRLDSILGAKRWSVSRGDIRGVTRVPGRGLDLDIETRAAGRHRLRTQGREQLIAILNPG